IQNRPDTPRPAKKIGKVARRQIGSKVLEALRQHWRVRVELTPKVQTAIPGIVRFKHKTVADLALETKVGLVTFRNAQGEIQAARESGIEHPELFDQRRVGGECLGKVKARGDECATLGVAHQLARGRIDQRVRVKEKLLSAQGEI